jgi:hypothetical protein
MTSPNSSFPITVEYALQLFKLTEPFSREDLRQNYEEARRIWHPARYAGLTNNPAKYMEMYKKGEAKTKDIEAAYQRLLTYLHSKEEQSAPAFTLENHSEREIP